MRSTCTSMSRNKNIKRLRSNECNDEYMVNSNNNNDRKKCLQSISISEKDDLMMQYKLSISCITTQQSNYIGYNKSKRCNEIERRRLESSHMSCKKLLFKGNTSYSLNMKKITMLNFTFILFFCLNSVVMAFHLNEESNSVYPNVKSILSSSSSHKRHSKTIGVFYPNGVSFFTFCNQYVLFKITHKSYHKSDVVGSFYS